MPRVWVGSDRLAEFAISTTAETALEYGHHISKDRDETGELEARGEKVRHTSTVTSRRSLTGGHSAVADGCRLEYQRSRSMLLTHGDRKNHREVMVRSCFRVESLQVSQPVPRKRAGNAISRGSKKAKQGRGLVRIELGRSPPHWPSSDSGLAATSPHPRPPAAGGDRHESESRAPRRHPRRHPP
jgi:hypothetical protein